jgi:mono/diheme cytochrome c family protein
VLVPVRLQVFLLTGLLAACAADSGPSIQDEYRELDAITVLDAPAPTSVGSSVQLREKVARGRYLVELLGCGACHTDGALVGAPDPARALAGSRTGIAYTNPLGDERPGVVYPPNITPDLETGIGKLSDADIAAAIRAGRGSHGQDRTVVMPWPGFARLTGEDVGAIVAYLRSIPPVSHRVPAPVKPGEPARAPFVYFGVYERR